jgi:hypothetical protein
VQAAGCSPSLFYLGRILCPSKSVCCNVQFSAAYSTGKALVPLPHSVINALENTMSDLGGSLISSAQQQSEKVRTQYSRGQHRPRISHLLGSLTPLEHGHRHIDPCSLHCVDASSTCVASVAQSVLVHCCVLQALYALDAKVDSVVSMATGEGRGPGVFPTEVWWESLSHRPPFKYMVSAYQQAHDAVVQTPIYTKCVFSNCQ